MMLQEDLKHWNNWINKLCTHSVKDCYYFLGPGMVGRDLLGNCTVWLLMHKHSNTTWTWPIASAIILLCSPLTTMVAIFRLLYFTKYKNLKFPFHFRSAIMNNEPNTLTQHRGQPACGQEKPEDLVWQAGWVSAWPESSAASPFI